MAETQIILFNNISEQTIVLVIEPWGDEISIAPSAKVHIEIENAKVDGLIEIEQGTGKTYIHGYDGSIIRVTSNGTELFE